MQAKPPSTEDYFIKFSKWGIFNNLEEVSLLQSWLKFRVQEGGSGVGWDTR